MLADASMAAFHSPPSNPLMMSEQRFRSASAGPLSMLASSSAPIWRSTSRCSGVPPLSLCGMFGGENFGFVESLDVHGVSLVEEGLPPCGKRLRDGLPQFLADSGHQPAVRALVVE